MQHLWTELRQTARGLAMARGFTGAVIGILAAAVALATTTLRVVDAYLGRSLPYPAAERLYRIAYSTPDEQEPRMLELADWRALDGVAEERIAWDLDVFYMLGGEYPERVSGQWVTPGFMRALGVTPVLGRALVITDFRPDAPQVAVIGDELWRRRFGSDPSIIGRRFNAYVSDRPRDPTTFTIVGVLPSSFWHVNPYTQVLTPLRAPTYPYFLRLRRGVDPAAVEARLAAIVRRADPSLPSSWRPRVELVHEAYTRRVRPLLAALSAAVTLVVLIACANVALLMVLRGMARHRDMAVRAALGASLGRLARLLVGEALMLCATAATVGAALGAFLLHAFGPLIEEQIGRGVPGGSAALSLDARTGVVVALLALVIALATGSSPVLVARRATIARAASGTARASSGPGAAHGRFLLVSSQIAGTFALLAGCGLMVQTLRNLVHVETGMQVGEIVSANLATREQRYATTAAFAELYDRLVTSLRATAGIRAVALSTPPPLMSYDTRRVTGAADGGRDSRAAIRAVSEGYFAMLRIALVDGRDFSAGDREGAEPVAIISEASARSLFPTSRAVGKHVRIYEQRRGSDDSSLASRRVIGVVATVRQSPTDTVTGDVYLPLRQSPSRFVSILAEPAGAPLPWAATFRRALRSIDPEATITEPTALAQAVRDQTRRPRFIVALFGAFGLFALAIGMVGVYAVTAYSVRQREREIAVRVAVGADRMSVLRMFLRQAGGQLAVGLLVGAVAGNGVGRTLAAELFGTPPTDVTTLAVVGPLLALAVLAAVALPAWRASGADPTISLRAP